MLAFITAAAWAQLPDGKDVPTAVPIVLGQTVEDAGSATVTANRVYKITLARGQKVTLTARFGQGVDNWSFYLMRPATRTIFTDFNQNAVAITYTRGNAALTHTVTITESGVYYIGVSFYDASRGNFTLRVDAEGTPIAVPNPTRAGCLNGKVESVTYSLQFVAVGLPDEVVIGGQRACATCQVKAPIYPDLAARLDTAMLAGASVEACYDSAGGIFQIKLSK